MRLSDAIDGYGVVTRLLHWLMAVFIVGLPLNPVGDRTHLHILRPCLGGLMLQSDAVACGGIGIGLVIVAQLFKIV